MSKRKKKDNERPNMQCNGSILKIDYIRNVLVVQYHIERSIRYTRNQHRVWVPVVKIRRERSLYAFRGHHV